jgi:hypothetical protein
LLPQVRRLAFQACAGLAISPVATTSPDAFHQKTTDELQFFVQNPGFYHPDLVRAASLELRRRGIVPAPPTSLAAPAVEDPEFAPAPGGRRGLWVALGVAALLGGAWWVADYTRDNPAMPAVAETKTAADTTLTLASAPSSPLPTYDAAVEECIDEQLRKVPAREKTAAQELSQYRELSKRFWTAQLLSEYIQQKAQTDPENTFLPAQTELVRNAWNDWSKATVYGYKFGPVMADHYDRMTRVATQEQEGLRALANQLATGTPMPAAEATEREADTQDLLAGLIRVSPATKRPYRLRERHVRL